MIVGKLEVPVDASELVEALEVLQSWHGREGQIPLALRAQVQRLLQARAPADLTDTIAGREISVVLKPEVRAVIANLRALEA